MDTAARSASTATLAETGRKTIFFAPRLIPSVAMLDPELTLSLPATITALGVQTLFASFFVSILGLKKK